jgi:hypothetical protein
MNIETKVGAFVLASHRNPVRDVFMVGNVEFGAIRVPYKTYLRQAGGLAPGHRSFVWRDRGRKDHRRQARPGRPDAD